MSQWVLIYILFNGGNNVVGTHAVPFATQQACEAAGVAMARVSELRILFTCASTGYENRPKIG